MQVLLFRCLSFLLVFNYIICSFLPDHSFAEKSKDSTAAETTTVESVPLPTAQRPDDLRTTPGAVPITDVDSELSSPGSEPLQASTPAEKPSPKVTYDTLEGELRSSTSETEKQETTDDGRTITLRVKTIRYYQPVVHRTLADGVVVSETPEDVLVGSYVDEYCFDAPLDVVDVYSASVETQTSVDETEQTLDDGTWLRRKVTRVVAYLAVDEEDTGSTPDAGAKPKLAAEVDHNLPTDSKHADQPDHETKTEPEVQRSTAEAPLKSKECPAGAAECPSEQAILKPADEPVDTVSQPDGEPVQYAQLESGPISCETTKASADSSDLTCKVEPSSPEELMPVTEELIMAVPNPRQEKARPPVTAVPITSSFDEADEFPPGEQFIDAKQTVEQFASPRCDLEPVNEEVITPRLRTSKGPALDTTKPNSKSEETVSVPGSMHESTKVECREDHHAVPAVENQEALIKSEVEECSEDKTVTTVESKLLTEQQHIVDLVQQEIAPVTEELIVAVPNPRQEKSRPVVASSPITSSFDEPEELIEECHIAEQFAAPPCDLKPVEEDVITPNIRHRVESAKGVVKRDFIQTHSEPKPEKSQQSHDLAKTSDTDTTTIEQIVDSVMIAAEPRDSTTEPVPVTEELVIAVPNPRQERSRPIILTAPVTSSFDEPEEQLIEEQQTAEQFATPAHEMTPVEEDIIAPDIRPSRAVTLDTGTVVNKTIDGTSFVPVEKIKPTSDAVQFEPSQTTATTADQPRTRPVLVLKSDGDTKHAPAASTFVPTLPPLSSTRQPRRPRSANEMMTRRYGIESPQPGMYSRPRMRRESPLSFIDRLADPMSPTSPGMEDFDSPLFDDGRRQVKTRTKKMVTRKVRKVRHDGEVVEDIVTEEIPDYGYSDTSSVRSGQSPAYMSPRSPSVSSVTSPLPIEPASPGVESLSSQSSLRVFTDTVEGEPEVITDVQEREETLPDGRVVIRKIIRTRQKQTIVKRTVMEGPSADDEHPAEGSGQLVVAGEDIQKPDIRTYTDAMEMRPSTETISNDVEEVLPDGTVLRKLTTTTSTRQLKTDRTVVEGPYVPETVNQALQGDNLRHSETPMLPQLASSMSASRPASLTTKTSGSSRTSPRPKFRISMESPTPPVHGDAAVGKTTDPSHSATQDEQSYRPT